jgi:hypothetical protein
MNSVCIPLCQTSNKRCCNKIISILTFE